MIVLQLVNEVYEKEIESGKTELAVNEPMKKKAKKFIAKYMSSRGAVFKVIHSPTTDTGFCDNDQDSQNMDSTSPDVCSNAVSDIG